MKRTQDPRNAGVLSFTPGSHFAGEVRFPRGPFVLLAEGEESCTAALRRQGMSNRSWFGKGAGPELSCLYERYEVADCDCDSNNGEGVGRQQAGREESAEQTEFGKIDSGS